MTRNADPYLSAFGSRLRSLRNKAGLSQEEVADKAGVPVKSVDLFEHNLPVPLDYRRRIFKVLWAEKTKR